MNDLTNQTTQELGKKAKELYIILPTDQAEIECAPYIAELNKRFAEKAAKFGQGRRAFMIKKLQDLGRMRF